MKNELIQHITLGLMLVVMSLCLVLGRQHIVNFALRMRDWQLQNPAQLSLAVYIVAAVVFIGGICLTRKSILEGSLVIGFAIVLALCAKFTFKFLLSYMSQMDSYSLTAGMSKIVIFVVGAFAGLIGLYILASTFLRPRLP